MENNTSLIVDFIKGRAFSTRQFERLAGLPNGTINNAVKREADLSVDIIRKIVEKFSMELNIDGYAIIDMAAFNKPGELIIVRNLPDNAEAIKKHYIDKIEKNAEKIKKEDEYEEFKNTDTYKERYYKSLEKNNEILTANNSLLIKQMNDVYNGVVKVRDEIINRIDALEENQQTKAHKESESDANVIKEVQQLRTIVNGFYQTILGEQAKGRATLETLSEYFVREHKITPNDFAANVDRNLNVVLKEVLKKYDTPSG